MIDNPMLRGPEKRGGSHAFVQGDEGGGAGGRNDRCGGSDVGINAGGTLEDHTGEHKDAVPAPRTSTSRLGGIITAVTGVKHKNVSRHVSRPSSSSVSRSDLLRTSSPEVDSWTGRCNLLPPLSLS